ncbi:MAG: DUF2490 domain-containing protein [Opitutales bacterium]
MSAFFKIAVSLLLIATLLSLGLNQRAAASGQGIEDFETWHQLTWTYFQHDRLTLSLYGEARFNDNSTFNSFRSVKQQFGYRAAPWLDLAFKMTYQEVSSDSRDTRGDYRLEWEVTPFFQSRDGSRRLSFRNRVELFFTENVDSERWRWRLRVQLSQQLKGFWADSFSISNEFFYDFQPDDFNQNRFKPLGLNFKLNDRVTYGVFVLIDSDLGDDGFEHAFVLGQSLKF